MGGAGGPRRPTSCSPSLSEATRISGARIGLIVDWSDRGSSAASAKSASTGRNIMQWPANGIDAPCSTGITSSWLLVGVAAACGGLVGLPSGAPAARSTVDELDLDSGWVSPGRGAVVVSVAASTSCKR